MGCQLLQKVQRHTFFIHSLSLKFPCICSVPGMHTCHENFFYTWEHRSYSNVPWKGCFTMILTEAREESGNSRAIGKSCYIHIFEQVKILRNANFKGCLLSCFFWPTYLLVCVLGLLNLEWVHKEKLPPPVKSESAQEEHVGCVSPSWWPRSVLRLAKC